MLNLLFGLPTNGISLVNLYYGVIASETFTKRKMKWKRPECVSLKNTTNIDILKLNRGERFTKEGVVRLIFLFVVLFG